MSDGKLFWAIVDEDGSIWHDVTGAHGRAEIYGTRKAARRGLARFKVTYPKLSATIEKVATNDFS